LHQEHLAAPFQESKDIEDTVAALALMKYGDVNVSSLGNRYSMILSARAESRSGNSSPHSLKISERPQLVACHRECYTSLPGPQKLVLWSG
jgi:hypothetical protein